MLNHLSQLEHFTALGKFSYLPLVNTLQKGKLPLLEYIEEPKGQNHGFYGALNNYGACLMLIKPRLKHAVIFDGTRKLVRSNIYILGFSRLDFHNTEDYEAYYKRICHIMDTPHTFNELTVRRTTDDTIGYIELVLSKCADIHTLNLTLGGRFAEEEMEQSRWFDIAEVRNTLPAPNIKKLDLNLRDQFQYNFMPYLVHKFCQLDDLFITFHENELLDVPDFRYLLKLFKNTEYVDAPVIPVTFEALQEYIEYHVNLHRNRPSTKLLTLNHYDKLFNEAMDEVISVNFRKDDDTHTVSLDYQISTMVQEPYMILYRDYGRYFKTINVIVCEQLKNFMDTDVVPLRSDYLWCIFQYCSNLSVLTFDDYTIANFELLDMPAAITSKNLDKLVFSNCVVAEEVFAVLSSMLESVRKLSLKYDSISTYGASLDINMGNTSFTTLKISALANNCRFYHLKISTKTAGVIYCLCDATSDAPTFELSTQTQCDYFKLKAKHFHIQFQCDNLTMVKVNFAFEETLTLNLTT